MVGENNGSPRRGATGFSVELGGWSGEMEKAMFISKYLCGIFLQTGGFCRFLSHRSVLQHMKILGYTAKRCNQQEWYHYKQIKSFKAILIPISKIRNYG